MKKEKEIGILRQACMTYLRAKEIAKEKKAFIVKADTEEELKEIIESFSLKDDFLDYHGSELEFLEELEGCFIVNYEGERFWVSLIL